MTVNVIGLDPGPIPGIVTLHWLSHPGWVLDAVHAYQCGAATAAKLLALLLDEYGDDWAAAGIERYVDTGNLKSKRDHGGVTVRQERELTAVAAEHGVRPGCLPAATVKTWASARRMKESGVWPAIPAKLEHARSAAQVALYWAVRNGGVPDPLSTKAQRSQ